MKYNSVAVLVVFVSLFGYNFYQHQDADVTLLFYENKKIFVSRSLLKEGPEKMVMHLFTMCLQILNPSQKSEFALPVKQA
jgi:hypothetical protein